MCGDEPQEVSIDLCLAIVFIITGWSYRLKSGGASLSDMKDGFLGRGASTVTRVGTMTDNCIMPSEPAPLSEPTVWAAEQGTPWGIINSSVWSCWLILIEVNVGAEKYFDWWRWREAPPLRWPESLTWKALVATEGNSLPSDWRAGILSSWPPRWARSHRQSTVAWLNSDTHSSVGTKIYIYIWGQCSDNWGTTNQNVVWTTFWAS